MNMHRIYHFFFRYFRPKRMFLLWNKLGLSSETRALDVGGTAYNWNLLPIRPRLTIVNIDIPKDKESINHVNWVIADGRYLPFPNQFFDVVYSNSVIEHLSDLDSQKKFASECIRVGKAYFIQTPNKGFPIEPHYVTPFIHWLPKKLSKHLIRNFTVWGWFTRPTKEQCEARLQEIRLLGKREVKSFFPNAEVIQEKFLGLTKSIIAVERKR